MIIYETADLVIYDPHQMNVWTDGYSRVIPLTWNQGSIWARNERDGSKLNFSQTVFNKNFRIES